jgi:hypothetical protein
MIRSDRAIDAFALVHMSSAAGDALLAVALADSIFFSLPVGEARPKVALYLALTMAPLAVAAPLLVPVLDRAGARRMVSAGRAGRAVAACSQPRTPQLLLFPACSSCWCCPIHAVAKNDWWRPTEGDTRCRRTRSSAVAAVRLSGRRPGRAPEAERCAARPVRCGARVPARDHHHPAPNRSDVEVLRADEARRGSRSFLATAATDGVPARGAGFLLFLMAFSLRTAGEPPYWLGLLVFGRGGYVGDVLGPRLRPGLQAQTVVLGSLILAGAGAVFALSAYGLPTLVVFSFLAGGATELGRLAFQSLMQRTAPGNLSGRVFVRY